MRLPAVLDRPVAVVAHTDAALVALPGRVVGLATLPEQTLTVMHMTATRCAPRLCRGRHPHCRECRVCEQSSSLLMETVAFLNDGMRMSQRPRSSRPVFPGGGPPSLLPAAEAVPFDCGVPDEHRPVDHEPKDSPQS